MIEILHHKAEKLRETERFKEAIRLYDKVIEGYLEAKNYAGVADALQGKTLTYKHLFTRSKNKEYWTLAAINSEASLSYIKQHDLDHLYPSAYFRMGEVSRLVDDYTQTIKCFRKTYRLGKETKERGDYLYHLGEALYRAGKKKLGIKKIYEGLRLINKDKSKLDSFIYNVWKSGVYLRLAQIYFLEKDKVKAERYIGKAQEIIDSDKRLVIRAKQLKEIKSGKYYW